MVKKLAHNLMRRVAQAPILTGGVMVAILTLIPIISRQDAAFLGADDQAKTLVQDLAPGYQPWIQPLWEPPSGEVASLLFALQAAVGGALLGYGLAYLKFHRSHARPH